MLTKTGKVSDDVTRTSQYYPKASVWSRFSHVERLNACGKSKVKELSSQIALQCEKNVGATIAILWRTANRVKELVE